MEENIFFIHRQFLTIGKESREMGLRKESLIRKQFRCYGQ